MPTATVAPSATPTPSPTATASPLPSPTPTPPPTATASPEFDDDAAPDDLFFAAPPEVAPDVYLLPPGRHRINIFENDLVPASATVTVQADASLAPDLAEIDAGFITIDIPADKAFDVTFGYSVIAGAYEASTDVRISAIQFSYPDATSRDFGDESTTSDVDVASDLVGDPPSIVLGVPVDFGVPPALVSLNGLDLPVVPFLSAAIASGALWLLTRRRRSGYVAVDNIHRRSVARTSADDGEFHLRFDTEGIWATGRSKNGLVEVQTPNGRTWIPESGVTPHA